jgi:hypothetical protein
MDYYIYGHFDEKNLCRYIGKGRLNRAWTFCQRSKRWNNFFSKDRKPIVKILKENLTEKEALENEIHFISMALKNNEPLLNVTAGGELSDGWDQRAKDILSEDRKGKNTWTYGIPRPIETRKKISETKKANPEKIARYWKGKKRDQELMKKFIAAGQTKETRKKISEAKKGKKHSDEHKLKIKNSLPKKTVICLNTNEEFESINEAARIKNLTCSKVSEVANGIRKSVKGLKFIFKESQYEKSYSG